VIIVGSKGSGKSTVVEHVINGKKGFDGETTLSNFKQKLLQAIKVQIEPWNEGNFLFILFFGQEAQVFGEICGSIKKTKDGKVKFGFPTVKREFK
jgi:GTPase SAR1 family protein